MRPSNFIFKEGRLFLENISVEKIAQEIPTPFYLYSEASLEASCKAYTSNMDSSDLVCYSVKANNNLNILKTFVDSLVSPTYRCLRRIRILKNAVLS